MACEYDQHTSEYNSECDSFPCYLPWRTCNTVLFLQLCVLIGTRQVCLSLEVCRYISIRHVSIDERCAKVHQRFQVCHWVCKSGQVRHWVCKAFIYGSLLERGYVNYLRADLCPIFECWQHAFDEKPGVKKFWRLSACATWAEGSSKLNTEPEKPKSSRVIFSHRTASNFAVYKGMLVGN